MPRRFSDATLVTCGVQASRRQRQLQSAFHITAVALRKSDARPACLRLVRRAAYALGEIGGSPQEVQISILFVLPTSSDVRRLGSNAQMQFRSYLQDPSGRVVVFLDARYSLDGLQAAKQTVRSSPAIRHATASSGLGSHLRCFNFTDNIAPGSSSSAQRSAVPGGRSRSGALHASSAAAHRRPDIQQDMQLLQPRLAWEIQGCIDEDTWQRSKARRQEAARPTSPETEDLQRAASKLIPAHLEDVDGGLVDGAQHRAAGVHGVAHCSHHNLRGPCIQPCGGMADAGC